MSCIANAPVSIPSSVEVALAGQELNIKGSKGNLSLTIHELVEVTQDESELRFSAVNTTKKSHALSGTFRALVNNMVTGVSNGFEKQLELIGVGYRAQAQGKKLNLSLGFSHPVEYQVP